MTSILGQSTNIRKQSTGGAERSTNDQQQLTIRDQSTGTLLAINWYALELNSEGNCDQNKVDAKMSNGKYESKGFMF